MDADHSLHATAFTWFTNNPRQLTDLYLLAMAMSRDGAFVTFDASIAREAVRGAKACHLVQL